MSDKEIDVINRIKSIDDYARAMYAQAHIRWEEINVEKATTVQLIKARELIQKELDKRLVDAYRVLIGKSQAYHFKEDEINE